MNQEQVAQVVRREAYALQREGAPPYDFYIVNPMRVYTQLQRTRPDVVAHISRYYRGDPYQQIKVWVPRR